MDSQENGKNTIYMKKFCCILFSQKAFQDTSFKYYLLEKITTIISRVQMKSWAGKALETVNYCAFLKLT
jgi:hypothetical protein